jgi:hypothetical protein
VRGWFATVDHKDLGIRYLVTAFAFLIIGGVEALLMRIQLSQADLSFLSPEAYNQLFTMHGATMIFWYAAPILSGGATVEHFKNFGSDYPLGRAGQPCELTSIYVQLAANDASYTTRNIYGAGGSKG